MPMSEEAMPRPGPIEGTSRVLRELLRTPNFKKTVSILLGELDPENAGLLVRTLVWEDPEFFMSLFSAMPDILNTAIFALGELPRQLSVFPPGMLSGFLSEASGLIEAERLGEAVGLLLAMALELAGYKTRSSAETGSGFAGKFRKGFTGALSEAGRDKGAVDVVELLLPAMERAATAIGREAAREGSDTAAAINKLSEGIRGVAEKNPDFMRAAIAPLVEAGREALRTVETGEVSR